MSLTSDVEMAIELPREVATNNRVALLGASGRQQDVHARGAGEILVHQSPVILGNGKRRFDRLHREIEVQRKTFGVTNRQVSARLGVAPINR